MRWFTRLSKKFLTASKPFPPEVLPQSPGLHVKIEVQSLLQSKLGFGGQKRAIRKKAYPTPAPTANDDFQAPNARLGGCAEGKTDRVQVFPMAIRAPHSGIAPTPPQPLSATAQAAPQ